MKLKLKLLMILMTVFAMSMMVSAYAAGSTDMTVDVSGNTSKNGEITVKVNLTNNSNLGGLQGVITYDKSKLEYISGALDSSFTSSAAVAATDLLEVEEGISITASFNAACNYNGAIVEVKFKVLADAGEKVTVGLDSVELADIDYNEMEVNTKAADFTVAIPMERIDIEGEKNVTLIKGENATLTTKISPENTTETNKNVKWSSSDEAVATVDANGVVTAVGKGQAVITATTEVGELKDEANITVKVNLTGIALRAASESIEEGKTVTLSAVSVPDDATEEMGTVEWSSDDENIATVDNNGVVTAVKPGKVTITAKTDRFSDTITLTVTEAVVEPETSNVKPETPSVEPETSSMEPATLNISEENVTTVKDDNSTVKTGDSLDVGIITVMLVSVVVFGIAAYRRKKYLLKNNK